MFRAILPTTLALAVSTTLGGCGPVSTPPAQPGPQAGADNHGHDHPAGGHVHADEGPHGGHLIDLEDGKYHAELLHDHADHSVSVYLLDSASEKPVAADDAQITLQILADGQFVDYALTASADDPSHFTIVDDELCHALAEEDEMRGRINALIEGETASGDLEHAAHEHAEEGHAHHEADGHEHPEEVDAHDDDDGHAHDDDDGHEHGEDGHAHDDDDGHEHDEEDGHAHDDDHDHEE